MTDRYLVTGAAGFIGSKVCRMLIEAGHTVVGIDELNSAYDPRLKEWRLAQLNVSPSFSFERLDITDLRALERYFTSSCGSNALPFRAILNLGARAGVHPSVADPFIYLRTNAEGTLNLLEVCRRHGIRKFVLASTSSLYGAHNRAPFSEDADTDRPLSPYAASKKAAEAMAFAYHHLHGLDVSVLRYFTVYGPAGRPDMSVLRFIRRIAEGEPITLFGDGEQQRDFTYVDDVARGTIAAVAPLGYEVINLGGDRTTTVNSLIEEIAALVGRPPIIDRKPAHPADVPVTRADVRKAKSLLGWSPQVPLREGIRATAEWYRENRLFVLSLRFSES
jgi:UDP-glucuronate 4-epimerase